VTQQPPRTTAPPITTHPSISNPNHSHHQTSHYSHLKPKQTTNYLKKKTHRRASCHPTTTVHHGTTHHYPHIFLKPKPFQLSNITPQTQTKPKSKNLKKKIPIPTTAAPPNWPCNRHLHSSWPSNRHLQFIMISNPTTKLLTADYSVRFVVKPALKPFRWRSCWSRVWNFRLELERDIFWREEKEREIFWAWRRENFCVIREEERNYRT